MSDDRRPDPVRLRDALAEFTHDLGMPPPELLAELAAAWAGAAGETLAEHARLRSLREGVLVVGVDSPAWATQVRYLASDLLAGLRERLGDGAPTDLRVVVEGR